jgi:hypothetical protein
LIRRALMSTKSNPESESHADEREAVREAIRQNLHDQATDAALAEERGRTNSDASPADDIKLLGGIGGFSSAVKFSSELEADRKKKRKR